MSNLTHQAKEPLILHAHASGPNPIKIAIGLELLSIPYTVKMWNFGDDPQTGVKGSSFLKINENGRVPALEDPNTGVISWESGACMNYLRRRHYNPTKNEDALNRYAEQTDRCYSVLEGQLSKTKGESILPGGITAVDAHYEPWVRQHAFAQVPIDKYPNLSKWLEKMKGLDEVKKAYEKIEKAPKPGES
ncbi:hypothetical protein SLS59_009300 [Nothophoma quercina]|uniref:Glutathione S-transferase n=1 Tax=Nothophoma quercina TaxID=749835 RepID=A0ABR3QMP6_9PLEO